MRIFYFCLQLMGLISSRDFIDACTVRPLPDGGFITAASAVEGYPETPGCVRGKNKSCGLTFRPTGLCQKFLPPFLDEVQSSFSLLMFSITALGVRICWVIHSELGGSLPVALIDRAIPGTWLIECLFAL
jgi:hypothetical protein